MNAPLSSLAAAPKLEPGSAPPRRLTPAGSRRGLRAGRTRLAALLVVGAGVTIGCGDSTGTGGTPSTGGAGASTTEGGGGATGGTGFGGSTGGAPDTGGQGGTGGDGGSAPVCPSGTIQCNGSIKQVCDGNGGYSETTDCAPGGCVPNVGCTVCQPGVASCNGNVSSVCKPDGSGYDTYTCEPNQGSTCGANGHCTGTCAPESLGTSYIGCDYYPTVTNNGYLSYTSFTFAVAVANTANAPATITITQGGTTISTQTVNANSVNIIALPWVTALVAPGGTAMVTDGAYRLESTQPVTVYQYNPLEYTTGFSNSYTNDASLLLPTNAWTGNYRVASWNSFYTLPGFYAVTASQDNTTVTLSPSATGNAVLAGAGVNADGTGSVVINRGDVLQVLSSTNGLEVQTTDLTGTLVTADKPVQVIGGHECIYIPTNVGYCDHLEESMPPVETLADEYIVTPPAYAADGSADAEWVRLIATEANTTLSYDPPIGAPTSIANAGDYIQIASTNADFVVTADKPLLVSQAMRGQGDSGVPGDPAMALAVATAQYRDTYLFHAPTNYSSNYVNITAPSGATITLDGANVTGFVPIGGSGYSVARVPLSNAGDGNHEATGSAPFGISVYGYGDDTSYWYPGGLDLEHIN